MIVLLNDDNIVIYLDGICVGADKSLSVVHTSKKGTYYSIVEWRYLDGICVGTNKSLSVVQMS